MQWLKYTEKQKEYKKEYRELNKETIKEYQKKYHKTNKEQIAEHNKKYNQTEKGRKSKRIQTWKIKGVICEDFNELYEYYINCWNCEDCNVELVEGRYSANKRCLDHDHTTGLFRNVLCHTCNMKRGRIDNNIVRLTPVEYRWKHKLKQFILS